MSSSDVSDLEAEKKKIKKNKKEESDSEDTEAEKAKKKEVRFAWNLCCDFVEIICFLEICILMT